MRLVNGVALIVMGAAAMLAPIASSAVAQGGAAPAGATSGTVLRIEAEGEVSVKPDRMSLSAGVVTRAAKAAEALEANNQLVAQLIAAVKASGIPIARLQTSELAVDPQISNRDDGPSEGRIIGFIARNSLDIDLSEVASAGSLISLMFEAGANNIAGPYFSLRDPAPAYREAERKAIRAAREEAENYAEALDMRVARVLLVSDTRNRDVRGKGAIIISGSRIRSTPVEPGEVTVSVGVSVEFLLEPR